MDIRTWYERTIYSSPSEMSFATRIFLSPFYFISLIYRVFITLRLSLYRIGMLPSHHLPCKVISVGNITVGGTGKTPTVMFLAHLLKNQGKKVAVLSRGYKGKRSKEMGVVSDGKEVFLEVPDAGDEPFLLSRSLPGVPVIIGKNRVRTGRYALEHFSPEVMLLDDGFQYLKLKRDLDILLIDLTSEFGNGYLLPRGVLREPLSSLSRAHLFLLTKKMETKDTEVLIRTIRWYKPDAEVFFAHYEVTRIFTLQKEEEIDPDSLRGKKVVALSGVANSSYFSYLLRELGMAVVGELRLPDHHHYTLKDATTLSHYLTHTDFIITTAKDWVKMGDQAFKKLPILVVEIVLKIRDESLFRNTLFKHLS